MALTKLKLSEGAAMILILSLAFVIGCVVTHFFPAFSFPWIAWCALGYGAIVTFGREMIVVRDPSDGPAPGSLEASLNTAREPMSKVFSRHRKSKKRGAKCQPGANARCTQTLTKPVRRSTKSSFRQPSKRCLRPSSRRLGSNSQANKVIPRWGHTHRRQTRPAHGHRLAATPRSAGHRGHCRRRRQRRARSVSMRAGIIGRRPALPRRRMHGLEPARRRDRTHRLAQLIPVDTKGQDLGSAV